MHCKFFLILALLLASCGGVPEVDSPIDYSLDLTDLTAERFDQAGYELHSLWATTAAPQRYKVVAMSNQTPDTKQWVTDARLKLPMSRGGYRYNLFAGSKGGTAISFYIKYKRISHPDQGNVNLSAADISKELDAQLPSAVWPERVSLSPPSR